MRLPRDALGGGWRPVTSAFRIADRGILSMPFIPHTKDDVRHMLEVIGVEEVEQLFDEIPPHLRAPALDLAEGASERRIVQAVQRFADDNRRLLCFAGGGAYDHYIPAAVWQIAARGEFYSAYTPYQAEASQGTLQLIYEFQSMISALTGMEVANASLYDGASALAEAVLMAVRIRRAGNGARVLMPVTVNPIWRRVVETIVANQGIELIRVDVDRTTGRVDVAALNSVAERAALSGHAPLAIVIPQPNVFGVIEDVDTLTDWATDRGLLTIGAVNPVSLAVLKPPGSWGRDGKGVDIVVGEGQPLGVPLSSGGPYFGFMTTRKIHIRQMPGRIVGRAMDADGRPGFVLTLQAREQHIRRSKATSNICTNQGLLVTAATIHLSILGEAGLVDVATASMGQTRRLVAGLQERGVRALYDAPHFHEVALDFGSRARAVLAHMAEQSGVLGGIMVEDLWSRVAAERDAVDPRLAAAVLVCATEQRDDDDVERYWTAYDRAVSALGGPN